MKLIKHKRTEHGLKNEQLIEQFDDINEARTVLGEDILLGLLNRSYKNIQLNVDKALKLRVDSKEAVSSYLRSVIKSLTSDKEWAELASSLGCNIQTLKHLIGETKI